MKRLMVAVMVAASVALVGCEQMQEPEGDALPEEGPKATEAAEQPSVAAPTVVIGDQSWTVEVAATPKERIKGLGGRESLSSGTGMWFVFPDDSSDPFWMKDTNFNLDMVFVGSDMKVVDVKLDNAALTEDLIQPADAYRYVLEVPAGDAAEVEVGDVVDYRVGPQ